jgi:hypothetical protein
MLLKQIMRAGLYTLGVLFLLASAAIGWSAWENKKTQIEYGPYAQRSVDAVASSTKVTPSIDQASSRNSEVCD